MFGVMLRDMFGVMFRDMFGIMFGVMFRIMLRGTEWLLTGREQLR